MIGKFGGQSPMRPVGLGHYQESARVLVEAVNDARPGDPADARQARAAMGEQRIDESPVHIAGPRMHDETGRLVDHDEGIVLIDNIERDRLRHGSRGRGLGQGDLEALPQFDPVFWVLYGHPAAGHLTLLDQILQPCAAQVRQAITQEAIQPHA